ALDGGGLTVYHGIDPSVGSLHVGHLIGVLTLRRLQLAGHRPIALAGGGTGLIGDPGGRDTERPLLTEEQVEANVAGIRAQLESLLDFSPAGGGSTGGGALLVNNADWLTTYRLVDFLRDVGKHFTVNQMIAKESVRARIDRPEQGISFTEFSYMLLQACDYLYLHDHYGCRLQIGGSDQWGNITMGLEYVRKLRHVDAHAFTWPLLTRADGSKIGKSDAAGVAWLDPERTSPYALYQYFVRKADDEVGPLLRFYSFRGREEILELDAATEQRPQAREAQRALAYEVCALVHGEAEAKRAEAAAAALYSEEITSLDEGLLLDVVGDAPSSVLARSSLEAGVPLVDALVAAGLSPSRSAARTAVSQGGAYVNNRRRAGEDERLTADDLLYGRYVVLRRGRRDYHLLRVE
ncbi:MAG TPA: tyrosine--tRNA ligase, partial [Acidimicrobiales bacterium]|nr:tyrosine--tRNA ligase [Acidimicrobiales bacterium]